MSTEYKLILESIKTVQNFPQTGVNFLDITPLLEDKYKFKTLIDSLAGLIEGIHFDSFLAMESRGFLLGSALSYKLNKGLIIARKPKKLPRQNEDEIAFKDYKLEYGSDRVEVIKSSLQKSKNIIIVDDVLATGGTASACKDLCIDLNVKVEAFLFLIELSFLKGRERLGNNKALSLIKK